MPQEEHIKITIAVPVYDRIRYLDQALTSCLTQSYGNFELLVCDSSPHSKIKDLCASYSDERIHYMQKSPETPILDKFNSLLNQARGQWMVYLADDDYFDPAFLETMMRHIQKNPSATLVRSRYRIIDDRGKFKYTDGKMPVRMDFAEFLSLVFLPGYKMNITGVMFPTLLLRELGGIESLDTPWDSDRLAWIKLASRGTVICEPKPLCSIRAHGDTYSIKTRWPYEAYLQTHEKVKRRVEAMLRALANRGLSESDHKKRQIIHHHLSAYTLIQMQRAYDFEMLQLLDSVNGDIRRRLDELIQEMKGRHMPIFHSVRLYQWLAWLPLGLRARILRPVKSYKIKKVIG